MLTSWLQRHAPYLLIIGVASCSGGAGSGDAGALLDGTTIDADGGACPPAFGGVATSVYGQTSSRFHVSAYDSWVLLDGRIYDGPTIEFHSEAERQGACRLLTYVSSFCDPACAAGQACVDSECVDYPGLQSVGTVVLGGVGDDVDISPSAEGGYSWFTDQVGIVALTTVELVAPGGVGPAFEIAACVPPTPLPSSDWVALLGARADGEDVTLTWSNPVDWARIYLRMTTGIGTHGGISPVEVECEGPDTGSLTIPGSYLDALYAGGWSCGECGGNDLFRYHSREVTSADHTVQLRVQSSASFWFHPNLD